MFSYLAKYLNPQKHIASACKGSKKAKGVVWVHDLRFNSDTFGS
jgi:hypothetical protein